MTSFIHMYPMLTHMDTNCAVAQLAVASDFESDGWRFESFLRSKISIIICLLSSRSSMEERFFDSELTIVRFNPGRLTIMLAMYAVWIQIYRMSRNTAIFRYGGYKQPVNKPTCVNANHITMRLRMQIRHMMMRYCHRCHCRIRSGLMMNPLHAWFRTMKWYEWMSSLRTMPSYVECGAACPAWLWAYGWFPTGLRHDAWMHYNHGRIRFLLSRSIRINEFHFIQKYWYYCIHDYRAIEIWFNAARNGNTIQSISWYYNKYVWCSHENENIWEWYPFNRKCQI